MFCQNCKKEVNTITEKTVDCDECQGTGIGHHADTKCGKCKGRGYLIVEPYERCAECENPIES